MSNIELTQSQIDNIETGVILFLITSFLGLLAFLVRYFFLFLVEKKVNNKLAEINVELNKHKIEEYLKFLGQVDDANIERVKIYKKAYEAFMEWMLVKHIQKWRADEEGKLYFDYIKASREHELALKETLKISAAKLSAVADEELKAKIKVFKRTVKDINSIFDNNIQTFQAAIDMNHYRKGHKHVLTNAKEIPKELWVRAAEEFEEIQSLMSKELKRK